MHFFIISNNIGMFSLFVLMLGCRLPFDVYLILSAFLSLSITKHKQQPHVVLLKLSSRTHVSKKSYLCSSVYHV